MKLKGLIWFFVVLLIGISVYLLSHTWVISGFENKIKAKVTKLVKGQYPNAAGAELNELIDAKLYDTLATDAVRATKIFPVTGKTYGECKNSELKLGLDLQGGMSVTMDVSLEKFIRGLSNDPSNAALVKALQTATAEKAVSDKDYIGLFQKAFEGQNAGVKLAGLFAGPKMPRIKASDDNTAVIGSLRTESKGAINQTYKILSKRIDKLGVVSPNISLDDNKGIINVELAGIKDKDRAKKFLVTSANLEFWEVYNLSTQEFQEALKKADEAAAAVVNDTTNKNPIFSLMQVRQPYQDGDKTVFPAELGYVAKQFKDRLDTIFNWPSVKQSFPPDAKILFGKEIEGDGKSPSSFAIYAIKTNNRLKAELEGDHITAAKDDIDQSGKVEVTMQMDGVGAQRWGAMTTRNVGKPVAIVMDDIVYSAPNVNEPILTGSSSISMGGNDKAKSLQEAKDLAELLLTGRLDAPAKIVAVQEVGASLGEGTVKGGKMSFLISFGIIFLLMLVYYNTAGWVANIALILNLLFTVGVLTALHGTLTAAGIAGLVLTIGMAVDTNVIIFERIKEELTKGKSYQQAVIEGYKRSLPPVLDAHFTTFLTALILFIFGLGPVKGFATMQMLGIALSLFCGILVSRLITDWWTNKNRHFNYFTPLSKRIFKHANFKFIEYRKVAYIISIFVLLAGVGSYFNGYEKGVEFKGGTSYSVEFKNAITDLDAVKKNLHTAFGDQPVVKTQGNSRTLNITTSYMKGVDNADSAKAAKLYEGLKPVLGNTSYSDFVKTNIKGSNSVSPSISEDLKSGAIWATCIAIVIIFLYIFLRFSDWRYSLGTIVALLHDVFVTLAVFSFFKHIVPFPLEIDQHFIAAVLTVIGFSMNDTVIVFDRVREYSRQMKNADKGTIINRAINDTLSRTIMTSLTVFLTILILFIFGGEATRGFAFAMLIGVVTGTYSSIFVAAPILVDFAKDKPLGEAEIFGSSDAKPAAKKA